MAQINTSFIWPVIVIDSVKNVYSVTFHENWSSALYIIKIKTNPWRCKFTLEWLPKKNTEPVKIDKYSIKKLTWYQ